jgi:hypothetical protein
MRYITKFPFTIVRDEEEIEVTIGVTYYEPLLRGRYSGRPEDCYEDEGGFGEYDVLGFDYKDLTAEEEQMIQELIVDELDREAFETEADYCD